MLLLGKTWVFWECHWACQQRAVETQLFLLQATSKHHAEDVVVCGFFSPCCFLSFVLAASICVLPFFSQKILLVTGVCRGQRAAGGLKQSLMSCRAGRPLLGPCAGPPRACHHKVAHGGLLLLLHRKAICWLMVFPVLNLGLRRSPTPALHLSSCGGDLFPCRDAGHCSLEELQCAMLKLVGMFSVRQGLSLHSQVVCKLPRRSPHAQHL